MDSLLYGKDLTQKIVGLQVHDGSVEIFVSDEQGNVTSEVRENKYWLLSPNKLDSSWMRLGGDLHFKWGKQFKDRENFVKSRSYNKKHGIYSIWEPKESCMVNKGITYFKGMKPADLSVLSFDLETTTLDPNHPDAKILLISNTFRKNGNIVKKLFSYDEYHTIGEMLKAWSNWVVEMNPMVLTGYNIFQFDLNYMIVLGGDELKIGRDGSILKQENYEAYYRIDQTRGLDYRMVNCYGREIIDGLMLAYKYDAAAKKYDNYRLKRIIEIEGLQKENRQFYEADKIRVNYTIPEEWEKIKNYCVDDSDDGLAIFDLMATPYFYMTQMIPKSFQSVVCSATGSQINSMMMRAYLQDRHSLPQTSAEAEYEGAISIGNPGIYDNVGKIDVASLYPSIMIQYEVCNPEKDPNRYFLGLVKTLTDLRLEYKKLGKTDKTYDDMQNAFKILINSSYGFLGTGGLLFNAPEKASFITRIGREVLMKSIVWATGNEVDRIPDPDEKKKFIWVTGKKISEGRGFKLVNADTDSISFCKEDMSKISEEEFKSYLQEINKLYPSRIRWEDDGIFNRVIVVRAKNYILWDGKKLKTKGSALKASTKCVALKEFIAKVIDHLVHNQGDLKQIYMDYVHEIMMVKDIKRWSLRKTISEKVMNGDRTNETKVKDAIENTEYVEGDRVRMFYKIDDTLELEENFNGDYNRPRLLKNLFDTMKIFSPVINDLKLLCPNYSLVRNYKPMLQSYGVEDKTA